MISRLSAVNVPNHCINSSMEGSKMANRTQQLAAQITTSPSFHAITPVLVELGQILQAKAKERWPSDVGARHKFLYGALLALDEAFEWDVLTQSQLSEERTFYMFTYLLAYKG
jgi:hypothetical protein